MPKNTKKNIPGLSKSIQFDSLQSNHSVEDETPDPPKAFLFFLGVTGVNMLDKSMKDMVKMKKI